LRSQDILRDGVRAQPDISVIATRKEHELEVLIWNYHDDDLPAAASPIDLNITGLPTKTSHGLLEHFRIDSDHSNAFTVWKEMGSPQSPTTEQHERLERAGQLQLLSSPAWMPIARGSAHLQFALPRQGLSLVRITWE
jgi:xylan 1,4-beta-xylosidase